MSNNTSNLKLVIVDFDNTLFDTNKANFISYKKAFNDHGVKFNLKIFRQLAGLNKTDFYRKVIGKKFLEITESIYAKKKIYYSKNLRFVKLNRQLLSILKILKKSKINICLVSNASPESINLVLKKFRLNNFFKEILTSKDMLKCKSDGLAFKKLMKKFKATKNNTIVIDDNDLGLKASKKNNLQAFIIKNFT